MRYWINIFLRTNKSVCQCPKLRLSIAKDDEECEHGGLKVTALSA